MGILIEEAEKFFSATVAGFLDCEDLISQIRAVKNDINQFIPFEENEGDITVSFTENFNSKDLLFVNIEEWSEAHGSFEYIARLPIKINSYNIDILNRRSMDDSNEPLTADQLVPVVEKWLLVQLNDFMSIEQKQEFLRRKHTKMMPAEPSPSKP